MQIRCSISCANPPKENKDYKILTFNSCNYLSAGKKYSLNEGSKHPIITKPNPINKVMYSIFDFFSLKINIPETLRTTTFNCPNMDAITVPLALVEYNNAKLAIPKEIPANTL
jgi:hypothetical protein